MPGDKDFKATLEENRENREKWNIKEKNLKKLTEKFLAVSNNIRMEDDALLENMLPSGKEGHKIAEKIFSARNALLGALNEAKFLILFTKD